MDLFKRKSKQIYGWDTFNSSRKADKRKGQASKLPRKRLKRDLEMQIFYDGYEEFIEENRNNRNLREVDK